MDEIVGKHVAITERVDPRKRVALYVDEWGTWHDQEPGTTPGFLYQQNGIRDAIAAAQTLNIFHTYADRVKLAAIAQMVNVLQAMILTDGPKMVLTPTYHVFDLYQVFQGATTLPIRVDAAPYAMGTRAVPRVSATAARGKDGAVHIALVNVDPVHPITVDVQLGGLTASTVTGRVLTAREMTAHNTFDAPNTVAPAAFSAASIAGGTLHAALPSKAVVVLTLR